LLCKLYETHVRVKRMVEKYRSPFPQEIRKRTQANTRKVLTTVQQWMVNQFWNLRKYVLFPSENC